jgi:hypothetical protein
VLGASGSDLSFQGSLPYSVARQSASTS